eukprot:gene3192-13209_t
MPFHLNQERLESWLTFQYIVGVTFILLSKYFKRNLKHIVYADHPETKAMLQAVFPIYFLVPRRLGLGSLAGRSEDISWDIVEMPFHLNQERLESWLTFQYIVGVTFILLSKYFKRNLKHIVYADHPETKAMLQRLRKELARKSFHIIGGTTIVAAYHYSLKQGLYSSAWQLEEQHEGQPPNFAVFFAPWAVGIWTLEFLRMVVFFAPWSEGIWTLEFWRMLFPGVNRFLFSMMQGIVREKEQASASGMSYFLPGALAAMVSYPPSQAMLAIMFLTMGDAAAGLGTAVGRIKVGSTSRKFEGTIAFWLVCFPMGVYTMDGCGGPKTKIVLAGSASLAAAISELWAEVICFDDNLFVPVVGGFALHYLVNLLTPVSPGQTSRMLTILAPYLIKLGHTGSG